MRPTFIDLSHHNTIPESLRPARKSGIRGVIHKATEGSSFVDDKLEARRHLALEARMLWGVYHFIRPGSVTDQAEFFVSTSMPVSDRRTLYALDWEDSAVSIDNALAFLYEVERLTGHVPVLYSGYVLKEALNGHADSRFSRYRLWLAQYGPTAELPPGWDSYWAWQYTDQGTVPGINPPTDLNTSRGNLRRGWSGRIS